MGSRLELHTLLTSIIGPNVYYQAPSTMVMKYPCIKYSLDEIKNDHADNVVYTQNLRYTLTILSNNTDDELVIKIARLPKCSFDRRFVQDGIYHTTFNIYY